MSNIVTIAGVTFNLNSYVSFVDTPEKSESADMWGVRANLDGNTLFWIFKTEEQAYQFHQGIIDELMVREEDETV